MFHLNSSCFRGIEMFAQVATVTVEFQCVFSYVYFTKIDVLSEEVTILQPLNGTMHTEYLLLSNLLK